LQKKHLDQAVERGAGVFDNGDLADLMHGRNDPRGEKGTMRSEYNVPHYFDAIAEDAAEWFEPYAHNIIGLAMGNHETSILKRSEINITERIIALLNAKTGSSIYNGGYSGFLVFNFDFSSVEGKKRSSEVVANYHHGSSSGKASANLNAHERRASFVPDADILLTGHSHTFYNQTVARLRLGRNGQVYHDEQLHLGLPSYKDDIKEGSEGWASQMGFRPHVLGAWWLRFFWCHKTERVLFEPVPAK
jgi:hypothetical protein